MPIKRKQGESKDDFMSRCISVEINAGKQIDQAAAICYAAWDEKQLKAIKNIRRKMRMAKVSIDYDDTLSTDKGKELAKRLLSEGNDVYIISARGDKERLKRLRSQALKNIGIITMMLLSNCQKQGKTFYNLRKLELLVKAAMLIR